MLATMKPNEPGIPNFAAAKSLEGRVWDLMGANNAKQAIAECEKLNRQYPEFGSGWHTTSHLMMRLGNVPAAFAAIERATSIDPDQTDWLLQRAKCLVRLGRVEEVDAAVKALSSRELSTAYQCSALALLLTQLGSREAAVDLYRKAIEFEPDKARHYYNIACLQRTLGELEPAERNFDKTISLDPADYESYKIRSDLRRQTAERNHIDELEQLLGAEIRDDRGRVQICYAVAKELEDLGEAERSFRHLKTGSDRRRKLMKYEVERDLETIEAIKRTFTRDVFTVPHDGCDNDEAIFILGMPRTGTTLVERILASHSDVFAAGELNNFAAQLMTMMRAQNIDKKVTRDEMVQSSAELDFRRLGEAYVKSTRPFTGKTARFIDKMPLNYLYVGLIHLALPNAKIINLKRNPMDTCYAIYKQLFVDAYPFSYDLEELARYYVAYHQLIEHWHAVLPGVIHTIQYESLVDDIEMQTRQMLDACGLDWQAQCLKFYENKEASTTASTAQIRRPIYKSSVGKWHDYEEQLQPVVEILQQAGVLQDTNAQ
jgi:tetratricopeptide (TPR) repeat protein